MGKFDGYLICSDIDGTLSDAGKISEENQKAISYFEAEGGVFAIATGRFADFPRLNLSYQPHGPIIAVNGTVIADSEERVIYQTPLSDEDKQIIIDSFAHRPGISGSLCFDNGAVDCNSEEELRTELQRETVYKIVYTANSEDECLAFCDWVRETYGDRIAVDRSWTHGAELHGPGTGKSNAMRWLKVHVGAHITVAVGDFDNDYEMIRDADIGYAVENANEYIKSVADRRAPSCDKSAIAYIIRQLEREIDAEN